MIDNSDDLDASCINPASISPNSRLSYLIVGITSQYAFLRNFIDSMLNPNQNLKALAIPYTYVSEEKII